jgi:hypothetical protein
MLWICKYFFKIRIRIFSLHVMLYQPWPNAATPGKQQSCGSGSVNRILELPVQTQKAKTNYGPGRIRILLGHFCSH